MPDTVYNYVFVRQDLPLADQLVQACHACLEAARTFGQPEGASLVLLGVESADHLHEALAHIHPIRAAKFYEPDNDGVRPGPMGYAAACTEPIRGSARERLRKFDLWSPPT